MLILLGIAILVVLLLIALGVRRDITIGVIVVLFAIFLLKATGVF